MVTSGLFAKRFSGTDFKAEQPSKVEPKSITLGLLAKRFSGMVVSASQLLKVP